MTANYTKLLNDPWAIRAWLATLWPYNPAVVQPDLLGDGVSTYGTVTASGVPIPPQGSFTFGIWVRPRTSLSALRYLVNLQSGTAAGQRSLYLSASGPNDVTWAVRNDAGTQYVIDSASNLPGGLPAGQWSYVAAVLDTTRMLILLYVNGTQVNSLAITGTYNTALSTMVVLRAADSASGYFDGEISELAIYNAALMPQVGPTNPLYPIYWYHGIPTPLAGSLLETTITSLYAYYRFAEGTGTTSADSTGYGRASFTLTNPIWGAGDWGAVQPHYFSSNGFCSQATDTPANMEYQDRIALPPLMTRAMYSGATIGGYSTPDYGEVDFANADGGLDFLRTFANDGRRCLIQYGGQLSINQGGAILALSDYGTIFDGVGSGDILIDEQEAAVPLKSKDWTFSKPLQTNYYTAAAPIKSASSDKLAAPTFPSQTGSLTVEGWYYIADVVTSTQILASMDDGTHGWFIQLNATNLMWCTHGLSSTVLASGSGTIALGWQHIAVAYDHTVQATYLYINGILVSSHTGLTGALASPSAGTYLTLLGVSAGAAGVGASTGTKASEVRIWNLARSATQVLQNFRVRMAGTESGLIGYWGLRDGGTAKVLADNSSGGNPVYMYGALTWDVADWVDSGVAGQTIPLTYGEVLELIPAIPDPYNLVYQVHDRQVLKIQAVYDKGLQLAAPFSFTDTTISFSGTTISSSNANADFSSLVPGQQVTISGSAHNNGTLTVAASAVASFTVTTTLTTEAAGASDTIVATAPQYTVDLNRGLIFLDTNPAGKISAWVRGDNPPGSYPSGGYINVGADIIRRIVTRHGGLNDPNDLNTGSFASYKTAAPGACGIYIFGSAAQDNQGVVTGASTGGSRTLLDVITEVAASNLAYFGFTRQANQFQVAQFQGVVGSPVATFDTTAITVNPPHQTLSLALPVWQVIVGYAQNYAQMSGSDLAADVQLLPARWNFCTKQWRFAQATNASVLANYSEAQTLVIYTDLINYADAFAEAKRQLALFGMRRDLYRITANASQLYTLDINNVVTYERNRFGLGSGRNFCVLAFDEQSNNGGAASGSGTLGTLGNSDIITADIWA